MDEIPIRDDYAGDICARDHGSFDMVIIHGAGQQMTPKDIATQYFNIFWEDDIANRITTEDPTEVMESCLWFAVLIIGNVLGKCPPAERSLILRQINDQISQLVIRVETVAHQTVVQAPDSRSAASGQST